MQPGAFLPSRDSRRRSRKRTSAPAGTAAVPLVPRAGRILVEAHSAVDLAALLAHLQAGMAGNPGDAAGPDSRSQQRGCAVLHADAPLPDREDIAAWLRMLPVRLPAEWESALLRDRPPDVRGLHPIELAPGRAWLLVAHQLTRRSRQRLARDLEDWRERPAMARGESRREAIVVGAGLAGCAMADAFARRGWQVTVLERSDRPGGVVADIPLLAQHPAFSRGEDRRSRLLVAALLASGRLEAGMGAAVARGGRFQAMPLAEARWRAAGMPADIAQVVEHSSASVHGVDGWSGLWLPRCATVDPTRWWRAVAARPEVTLRVATGVAAIRREAGLWCALDPRNAVIARAPVLVLANQAQAFGLAALDRQASGSLRRRPLQVLLGEPACTRAGTPELADRIDGARAGGATPVLGIDGYRLEWPGRACVIGPVPDCPDGAGAGIDALLAAWDRRLPGAGAAWSWRLSPPAERLLLRDNLPMAGAAPDMVAIETARECFQRNDRLALPRRGGLYLLTGLGGRGLLWSVLGAELVAALAADEPPVLEPELADAIDPARFVRRTLRRAHPSAEGTVPAQ